MGWDEELSQDPNLNIHQLIFLSFRTVGICCQMGGGARHHCRYLVIKCERWPVGFPGTPGHYRFGLRRQHKMLPAESPAASGLQLLKEMKRNGCIRAPEAWRLFPKSGEIAH